MGKAGSFKITDRNMEKQNNYCMKPNFCGKVHVFNTLRQCVKSVYHML
jgi:hypothetical protein